MRQLTTQYSLSPQLTRYCPAVLGNLVANSRIVCLSHTSAQLSVSTSVQARYWYWGRENCSAAEYLSRSQPVQKYLSPVTRDHEVPTMATGQQEQNRSARSS